jgi:hypothetical protein
VEDYSGNNLNSNNNNKTLEDYLEIKYKVIILEVDFLEIIITISQQVEVFLGIMHKVPVIYCYFTQVLSY